MSKKLSKTQKLKEKKKLIALGLTVVVILLSLVISAT